MYTNFPPFDFFTLFVEMVMMVGMIILTPSRRFVHEKERKNPVNLCTASGICLLIMCFYLRRSDRLTQNVSSHYVTTRCFSGSSLFFLCDNSLNRLLQRIDPDPDLGGSKVQAIQFNVHLVYFLTVPISKTTHRVKNECFLIWYRQINQCANFAFDKPTNGQTNVKHEMS